MAGLLTGADAERLAAAGRHGDTMLAHINPQEAALLRARGGAGTINPHTGLPEFYDGSENDRGVGSGGGPSGSGGGRSSGGGGAGSERGGSSSKSTTTKTSPAAAAAAAAGREAEYSKATSTATRDTDSRAAQQKQAAESLKQAGLQNLAGVGSKQYAGSLDVAKEGKSTLETLFDRLLPVDITPQYDALKDKRYVDVDLDLGELAGSAVGLVAGPLAGLAAGALLDNNLGKVSLNGATPATGTGTGSGASGGGGNGGENGGSSLAYQGTSGSGTTSGTTGSSTTTTAAPGGLLTGISGPSGGMTPAERFARDFYNGGKAGTATPQSFGEVTKWQG